MMIGAYTPGAGRHDVRRADWANTMPDDPSKTGSDRKRISLTQDHEVRDWCMTL